jgi:hypothetical protein
MSCINMRDDGLDNTDRRHVYRVIIDESTMIWRLDLFLFGVTSMIMTA